MKELRYTVKSEFGVHARPAGHIAGLASGYRCAITLCADKKAANAKNVLQVMGLALKCGDELAVTFIGEDEAAAATEMQLLFEQNI